MSYAILIGGIIGGYAATSFFFFRYPFLLHKVKKRKFRACHISHRGGAGERLENTMEAFRHAVSLGTNMLELDCHITRDGHVIVSHDDELDRSAGLDAAISDLCLDQLPTLSSSLEVTFAPGNVLSSSQLDRKFALLSDVFKEFPEIPINIDIKLNDDQLIKKVSNLVTDFDREEITVWGNFHADIVDKCRLENPRIPIIFSLRRVAVLLFYFYSGLLPFMPFPESFLEIPMPKSLDHGQPLNWRKRVFINLLDCLIMRRSLISHLQKRGITTFVWVCNTDAEFARAYDLGAEGVMTDYPTRLKNFLDQSPHIRERCMSLSN